MDAYFPLFRFKKTKVNCPGKTTSVQLLIAILVARVSSHTLQYMMVAGQEIRERYQKPAMAPYTSHISFTAFFQGLFNSAAVKSPLFAATYASFFKSSTL